MKKKVIISLSIILVVVGLVLWRQINPYHLEKQTRFTMDTYVTIYAVGSKKATARSVAMALDRIQEIDTKFNHLNAQSPLYAFNRQGTPITDPEIIGLIRTGLELSRLTDGAFDMTVTPLLELWGFYSGDYRIPAPVEIKKLLNVVGYKHLLLQDNRLVKDNPGVKIDLGGIAKGYAIAEAFKVLRAEGIKAALIDTGGDIYALGKKSRKQLWKVGIRNPRGEDLLGYVEVEDLAVIGSGDYERFFIKDGQRYCHIFNSKTGYPSKGVTGVTIIYSDPVESQVWAKIPFILGPEKGLKLIEQNRPDMKVMIVTEERKIIYSENLKQGLKSIAK